MSSQIDSQDTPKNIAHIPPGYCLERAEEIQELLASWDRETEAELLKELEDALRLDDNGEGMIPREVRAIAYAFLMEKWALLNPLDLMGLCIR